MLASRRKQSLGTCRDERLSSAGHDLDQANLPALKAAIPYLAEVSIGHALIGEALYAGLAQTVSAYLKILGA